MRLEGQRVGRYHLLHLLGSGGMGEVYLAEDPRIEQQVAIKVVQEESLSANEGDSSNKETADLFMREVKAIAKLDHPNILPLYDYGEEQINAVKITYIVMPYRKEGSLAVWLKKQAGKPLSPDDIAPFFLSQAARALQHAHEHQIIHQDVKPSNFLLRLSNDNPQYPDLLLADFGIAKLYSASVNMSVTIRGTPTFMAPEQWRGHPVYATDQYALAVMTYQILTGRLPFQGNLEQLMYAHIQEQPAPPSKVNPRVPAVIDAVVLQALAKQADQRYPSMIAFDAAFREAWQIASQKVASWVLPAQQFGNPAPPTPSLPVSSPAQSVGQTPPSSPVARQVPELHATLAISQEEALNGTVRVLTLPGGQQIQVPVQPGSFNGQEFRLERRGGTTGNESTEILVIKLAIVQSPVNPPSNPGLPPVSQKEAGNNRAYLAAAENPPPVSPLRLEATPSVGNFSPVAATFSSDSFPQMSVETPAHSLKDLIPTRRLGRVSRLRWQVLVALVLLILVVSVGGIISFNAIGQANLARSRATATRNAVNATTTASSFPYAPNTGKLVLSDPLTNNSRGYGWKSGSAGGGSGVSCSFTDGAYHIVEPNRGRFYYCVAKPTTFSDIVYQVQMTFVSGEDHSYGGLVIRSAGSRQYFFRVGRDGTYFLKLYTDDTTGKGTILKQGNASSIQKALGVPNILAMVAQGENFAIYINQQLITTVSDSSYHSGQIGLAVENEDTSSVVDVAFKNAKVWEI